MSIADAFAPAEAAHKARVMTETWGHLAPAPRQTYPGYIVFTHANYGHQFVAIDADFEGLDDSPWFFGDLMDDIRDHAPEQGVIYRFAGPYTRFKNGNCRFSGKISVLWQPVETGRAT